VTDDLAGAAPLIEPGPAFGQVRHWRPQRVCNVFQRREVLLIESANMGTDTERASLDEFRPEIGPYPLGHRDRAAQGDFAAQ
jgi:hypothetical protein